MASLLTLSAVTFTPPQRRLLGGWRDILDDVRHLSRCLAAMPDECRCGDATAHVGGSCACCQAADRAVTVSCDDCTALLATSGAKVDALVVDTLRFFPAFTHILVGTHPPDVQSAADEVQHEIGALVRTFQRICVAAEAFSTGCRASHLPILKQGANDLHAHAEHLERLL
ncbi:MAG TPA: hypothetical protein VI485_03165 [Vicinamibacterales bacterium]|nr:hypothetical protein [Vicinamibacterales bacterium]